MQAIKGKPSRVFGDPKKGAQVAVLMASWNAIDTIHRAMRRSQPPASASAFDTLTAHGDFLRLFLIAVGYLNEAVSSYWELHDEIRTVVKADSDKTLHDHLATTDRLLARSGSLVQWISHIRNDGAFHFQRDPLTKAIARFSDHEQTLAILDDTGRRHRFPFLDAVVGKAAGMPNSTDEMAMKYGEARSAMSGFLEVTSAYLAHKLHVADCALSEISSINSA